MSIDVARKMLAVEAQALKSLGDSLDSSFERLVEKVLSLKGRVVVTGMGKSGLVGHKIAATLSSTGTPSLFLHPADALHGDLGMVTAADLVLALSNSGSSGEVVELAPCIKRLGAYLVSATGKPESALAKASDLHIKVAIDEEACPLGLAPMASTTAQMAFGDALAAALIERRGFKEEDFARLHPGGKLGKRLMRVSELMHAGKDAPTVLTGTAMKDAIYEISSKKLGVAAVVDETGKVAGVITDGDLRRLLERHGGGLLSMTAGECAHASPLSLPPDSMAAEALGVMEGRKVTSLLVTDPEGLLLGVLHLHDLWGIELF